MIKQNLAALMGVALLVAPAMAMHHHHDGEHRGLDGRSFTVQVNEKHQHETKTDHISFNNGLMESEWLHGLGFEPARYEGHDHFDAHFRKGEEYVLYSGSIHGDNIHGSIKWSHHHQGGHTHFHFQGTAAAGAPVAEAPAAAAPAASLYQRLGGHDAIWAVVSRFIDILVADPVQTANPAIKRAFGKTDVAKLKLHLAQFVAMATGGAEKYEGAPLKPVHKNMKIGEKEWTAAVNDLVATLNEFKVPKNLQDELIAIVATTHNDVVTRP